MSRDISNLSFLLPLTCPYYVTSLLEKVLYLCAIPGTFLVASQVAKKKMKLIYLVEVIF